MSNILDYLKWRGDLELHRDPFNEVDNLLLSYVSYVDMDKVFGGDNPLSKSKCKSNTDSKPKRNPDCDSKSNSNARSKSGSKSLTLGEAYERYFECLDETQNFKDTSFTKDAPAVLKAMSETKRFQEVRLRNYVSEIDLSKNLQFAAMEFVLPDGASYIAFRGTDDRIVGWKEDFMLSGFEVEAQRKAVDYLNSVGKSINGTIHVGGHSKGAHLAVYAAACCNPSIQAKITDIYSHDGPGFLEDFVRSEELQSILPRVTRIVPGASVIGLLLEHACNPIVIESNGKLVMQHDPLTWMVEGPSFVKLEELDSQALVVEKTFKEWIAGFDEREKIDFIGELFSVIEAPGATTLTELQNGGIKNFQIMAKKINTLAPSTKQKISELFEVYFSNMLSSLGEEARSMLSAAMGSTASKY